VAIAGGCERGIDARAMSALSTQARETLDAVENWSQVHKELVSAMQTFFAGGVAGAVSRTAVAPLERLKIMCVHRIAFCESIPSSIRTPLVLLLLLSCRYMCDTTGEVRQQGVWGSLRRIWADDGLRGFFRGNGANMVR